MNQPSNSHRSVGKRAAADEQLVVASAVIVALRRIGPQLDNAAVGIDFDGRDWLEQIREAPLKGIGDFLELVD